MTNRPAYLKEKLLPTLGKVDYGTKDRSPFFEMMKAIRQNEPVFCSDCYNWNNSERIVKPVKAGDHITKGCYDGYHYCCNKCLNEFIIRFKKDTDKHLENSDLSDEDLKKLGWKRIHPCICDDAGPTECNGTDKICEVREK